ncbi:MAG: hypothetical protein DRJ52_07710 [Thermoprotei archaeon]|nr:MAG: hypothetical protein DRJ52_07710 [Thermoprotei archaeon]RLE98007.1 MAG: hypothetical protein DRJ63_08355 [Thermoprotei archaeon]HDI75428.1 hypothetical protein [Thermoprotei archaeon]
MPRATAEDLRFAADAMLGDLAKWLRVMGYDVVYDQTIEDTALLQLAEKEQRVILTKDKGLFEEALKRGLKCVYVKGTKIEEKLYRVAVETRLELKIDLSRTRCPKCNSVLRVEEKSEFIERLPPSVLMHQKVFWVCDLCGGVYWTGSHYVSMNKILKTVREKISRGE